jgi:hypothetical protein
MMKRLHVAAVLIPLAFFAGYTMPSGGSAPAPVVAGDPGLQAKPGKSSPRSPRPESQAAAPRSWNALQRRAGMSVDEMRDEMVAMLSAGVMYVGEDSWLLEQLISQDPAGTLRHARENCGPNAYENFTRWCSLHCPEETLGPLLDAWKSTPGTLGSNNSSPTFGFQGMGRVDPEKGLQMILDLPPGRRRPDFYMSLLDGVADSSPGQAFSYFERILSSGGFEEARLHELMPSLAKADPARAMEWTSKHFKPVPPRVTSQLITGLAKSDLPAALKLFEELPAQGSDRDSASFWIAHELTRDGLDPAWNWLARNSQPGNLEGDKGNALSRWAWHNPEDAAERILADPYLVTGERGSEMVSLMETLGKGDELVAMLQRLTPDQAGKLRPLLAASGLIEGGETRLDPSGLFFRTLSSDPAEAERIWDASDPGLQQQLIERMNQGVEHDQDPELAMKVLVKSTAGIDSPGGQMALARLSLVNPTAAAKLVDAIPDGPSRDKAIQTVLKNWSIDDTAAARSWSERATSPK